MLLIKFCHLIYHHDSLPPISSFNLLWLVIKQPKVCGQIPKVRTLSSKGLSYPKTNRQKNNEFSGYKLGVYQNRI